MQQRTLERIRRIKELLASEGEVSVERLASILSVSASTIRRNLQFIKAEGLIEHPHGSVRLVDAPSAVPPPLVESESVLAPSAVDAIAQLIRDDQVVILDLGPFSLQIARHVSKESRATIVTNSPEIATFFLTHRTIKVRMSGGQLRSGILIPTGEGEAGIFTKINATLCVLGHCNLDLKEVTTSDEEQANLRRVMLSGASQVAVMVSNESLGHASNFKVCPLSRITHIIPDNSVSNKKLEPYKNLGIKIIRG